MKRSINKTKWKKIKKSFKRVHQTRFLYEEQGVVFVMQRYEKIQQDNKGQV